MIGSSMRSLAVAGVVLALATSCRDQKTLGVGDGGIEADASRLPIIDGGPPADADLSPAGRIQEAKEADDGLVDISIEEATVTYLKPAAGQEGEGFFVQAKPEGPALFVGVDPDVLEPVPTPGDTVAFTITEMGSMSGGLRVAVQIDDYSHEGTGADLENFAQDVTAAGDLVTSLAGYDSEYIDIEATITGDFSFAGEGHKRAPLATTALPDSDMLALRIPEPMESDLNLTPGCSFSLRGIMWRFGGTAQPSGWTAGDFSDIVCAAPKVSTAVAASATSVVVTFDRPIDAGSVQPDGSQFAITPALAASGATADGNKITVTTAAQTPGLIYTIDVADTVTDAAGTSVDSAASSAMFKGYTLPATVVVNEVNANLPAGCDLVELRALSAGSIGAMELWARQQPIYIFPEMSLSAGDFVVVHLGSLTNCNLTGAVNELVSASASPSAIHPQNYDGAFDLYADTGGLTSTSNVLTLVDPVGSIIEAVLLHNGDPNVAGSSEARAAEVAAAGQWTTTAGMVPTGGFIDMDFIAHAVFGLATTDTDPSGSSISRTDDDDDDDASDWTAAPAASTWGQRNSGQTTP